MIGAEKVRRLSGSAKAAVMLAAIGCASTSQPFAFAKESNSTAFLNRNAREQGVVVLPGIQYRILASGSQDGDHPKLSGNLTVHYEGSLPSGEIFDSSFARGDPDTFKGREVIPGWQVALRLMRPGDEWMVYIPAELAYGAKGAGPIPPDSALIFRIHLISAAAEQ
ncbi:FKBP-type peptidyl-prolyl cis-trans isomerase [Sphingopyxis sp. YF1]|uniref:FKBP-type peptidyl-prolyl cis-trans isomerase n=1 Tax=unclassified Sphingopyxis TaxID=2614943 RepID=UPI001F61C0E8|nr:MULTISPECIES: FKBP-type peptidyl-prolyl cis-trans isomerase [unclassified Sphingopyxis]UNU44608.1 FKBP-type peptidyl-prolyl cis-trans isomerase [Sphingopyxis sp. YF1]USI76654.1 FKBP-type peptidyl-prolyl cis-trans isomerase [Sphingopyxis sp. USTB-05]